MIILVAIVIVGGAEALLRVFNVPQYILPKPSQIVVGAVHGMAASLAASRDHAL